MSDSVRPPESPAWTDLVLFAMGVSLLGGIVVGWLSTIPLRIGGSVGSLLATATFLGSIWWQPADHS
jgi:hypothetical protein